MQENIKITLLRIYTFQNSLFALSSSELILSAQTETAIISEDFSKTTNEKVDDANRILSEFSHVSSSVQIYVISAILTNYNNRTSQYCRIMYSRVFVLFFSPFLCVFAYLQYSRNTCWSDLISDTTRKKENKISKKK